MRQEQRNAIDACMREAGQPAIEWRRDSFTCRSDGTPVLKWGPRLPSGVDDVEQYWAYYRKALIVCGIVRSEETA